MRRRLGEADPSGALFTDVTGELVASDELGATILSRHGEVRVGWAEVVAAKEIPPKQARRGAPHRKVTIDDLQRLMVDGLPPLLSEPLGDWLLRASKGYTWRANSVLCVGDPATPLDNALRTTTSWYAAHGQPTLLQIACPTRSDPSDNAVASGVLRRGGRLFQRTLVMTAAVREVAMASAMEATAAAFHDAPTDDWWAMSSARTREHREVVTALLRGIRDGSYATLSDGARPVAAIRLAFSPGWAGLFDLNVPESLRGNGFGRLLVGAAAREAERRGARSIYLQVSADNEAAVGLYESLGFSTHHEYWYARLGQGSVP